MAKYMILNENKDWVETWLCDIENGTCTTKPYKNKARNYNASECADIEKYLTRWNYKYKKM